MKRPNLNEIKAYVDRRFVFRIENHRFHPLSNNEKQNLQSTLNQIGRIGAGIYEQIQESHCAKIEYTIGALTEEQLNNLRL